MITRISKEVQDRTTREFLTYLSTECGVPDEVIKNIMRVIDYIEGYIPEIVNAIDEMKSIWEFITNFNDPNQVERLKQSLMNYVTTYSEDPDQYSWDRAIVTRAQHPTYRKILEFLSNECREYLSDNTPDKVIQKLKWGIENSYVYKGDVLQLFDEMKHAWESITNFNDPNQVDRLKNELSKIANLFFKVSDRYILPQEFIDIVGKAKDPTYRELLMDLAQYVSNDAITNMVHIINNPDMYNDEILNELRNLRRMFYDLN